MFTKLCKSNKGMSLVSVLIAMGLAGALALIVARISKNATDVTVRSFSSLDELELVNEVKLIIADSRYCKISLANTLPFKKKNIDGVDSSGNLVDEGLDVELWLSDTNGAFKTRKKFNGENNPGSDDKSNYGKIKIKSIKLVMNNNTGTNYPDSMSHTDIGELQIKIAKKSSTTSRMDKNLRPISLRVQMETNSGNSTILSCSQDAVTAQRAAQVWSSNETSGKDPEGDTNSIFNCPSGYAISAVSAKTGNAWDSIQFRCRDLVTSYSSKFDSSRYGGTGGSGQGFNHPKCKCSSNGFISAIYMYTGSDTDGLGGDCVNSSFIPMSSFSKCGDKQGGSARRGRSICPSNSLATGALIIHNSSRIRSVKLLCTQKTEEIFW